MADSASTLKRSRTANMAPRADREKRRRSRVTPEQLGHLERFFAMDRSPTAARRKEISDMLGMQERQTQIWFQNRRAKAKLQDIKKNRATSSAAATPDAPPVLATAFEADLHNLLREDEPITIIPCTDLSVGTWRRIASDQRKHDLVAYLCDAKRCLTWYIHSLGYGFKMEIPFDIIMDTEFTNASPGSGLATFTLSQPPAFYLESFSSSHPAPGTESAREWKKCADWTEGQQATKVLRHNLVGSAVQLAHVLRHINVRMSGSDIRLHSPNYHSHSHEPSSSVLDVHPPSPTTLAGSAYHYHIQDDGDLRQPDQPTLTQKRSLSPTVIGQQHSLLDESIDIPVARPLGMIPGPNPTMYSLYPRHPTIEVSQPTLYLSYPNTALPYHMTRPSVSANHGPSQSSPHPSHQRQYSTGSIHSLSYEDVSRGHSLPNSLHTTESAVSTPSPPLLTTPFYPGGPTSNICTTSVYDPAIPIISGMPNPDTGS